MCVHICIFRAYRGCRVGACLHADARLISARTPSPPCQRVRRHVCISKHWHVCRRTHRHVHSPHRHRHVLSDTCAQPQGTGSHRLQSAPSCAVELTEGGMSCCVGLSCKTVYRDNSRGRGKRRGVTGQRGTICFQLQFKAKLGFDNPAGRPFPRKRRPARPSPQKSCFLPEACCRWAAETSS